ncbi:hypothetical protein Tco_0941931 [Tanacetum coccineum]|uniref:Uncharacterized protein n=1 Tax=Tanacetum coccineum TaxID=301880 RepID=A0ABQ5DSA2_9ASTR
MDRLDKRSSSMVRISTLHLYKEEVDAEFKEVYAPVMRTASAAAKPCQGDSLEFYLITGNIYTEKRGTVVVTTVFDERVIEVESYRIGELSKQRVIEAESYQSKELSDSELSE